MIENHVRIKIYKNRSLTMKFETVLCLWYVVILQNTCLCLQQICQYSVDFNNNGTKADCSRKHLSTIPNNLPQNTTYLDLSFNNLVVIQNLSFQYLEQLKILDLSFNDVRIIQNNAFGGLSNLIQLEINDHELSYNDRNSFPDDVFHSLKSLQILSLRCASSKGRPNKKPLILPDKAFEKLLNLTDLSIDTSAEVQFQEGFSKLHKLRSLDVGQRVSHGIKFNCQLKIITNNTFFMFQKLPIKTFKIIGCRFDHMGKMFLNSFPVVENLYLRGIWSPGKTLLDAIHAMSIYQHKSLTHVDLGIMQSSSVEVDLPVYVNLNILSNICITHLDISNNDIVSINFDELFQLPLPPLSKCLRVWILSKNRIIGKINMFSAIFGFSRLPELQKIDISLQKIMSVGSDFHKYKLDNTSLPLRILLPKKLEYVDAAGLSRISYMTGVTFINGEHMLYLNLSFLGLFPFSGPFIGMDSLEILDFSGNDCSEMINHFFDTLRNLIVLGLRNVRFPTPYILENGKRLLSPLKHLKRLDMSQNDIHVLPFDIFSNLVSLEELNLEGNRLDRIPDLSMLYAVKLVNLAFNSFVILDRQSRTMLDKMNPNVHLLMSGNLLSCACSSFDFLLWLNETKITLDGRNYSCRDDDGQVTSTQELFNNFDLYHRRCSSDVWLHVSTAGLLLLLVFVLAAFLAVKNTMKLKLVLLRMIGQYVYPERRSDFVYDVNILYSNKDYRFACIDLFNKLERQYGLKLNLSDRDYVPGEQVLTNICESIQSSWKIMIILTNDFLKWELSFFILCNCLSSIKLTTPNRLVLLIDSDVIIPTNIEFLLESVSQQNIIHLDIKEPQTEHFWNHLYDRIID